MFLKFYQPGAKHYSIQRKTACKTAKPNAFGLPLSQMEDVKLNQSENPWVPTAVKKATRVELNKNMNEEELKTEV